MRKPTDLRCFHIDWAKPMRLRDDPPVPWAMILQGGIIALVAIFGVALLVHSTGACK